MTGACTKTTCGQDEWQEILWKLQSYGPANNPQPVISNANITLYFYSNSKEIGGSGGCNHYFGSYTLKSNCELKITGLGATEMACQDSAIMQQEQHYLNLLVNTGKIEIKNGELRITCGTELLVYLR